MGNLSECQNLPRTVVSGASFGCLSVPVLPQISSFRSGFGVRPGRTTGDPTFHAGIDFKASAGDPVFAIAAGVVERVTSNSVLRGPFAGYGNSIVIKHPNGTWSYYAHLSSVRVVQGQQLAAGQWIGNAGNTTNGKFPGMGAHLHFEIRVAKPDGSSPFPGPYCRYNLDPKPIFESGGVGFSLFGGGISAESPVAICGQNQQRALIRQAADNIAAAKTRSSAELATIQKFKNLGLAGLSGPESDEENSYEPPEGPDFMPEYGKLVLYGGIGAGALMVAGAAYIRLRR